MKKHEILEEVYLWEKFAENRVANYSGLVNDHNSNWCTVFKKEKNTYMVMLREAIKELEVELEGLEAPSQKDLFKPT